MWWYALVFGGGLIAGVFAIWLIVVTTKTYF